MTYDIYKKFTSNINDRQVGSKSGKTKLALSVSYKEDFRTSKIIISRDGHYYNNNKRVNPVRRYINPEWMYQRAKL